MVEKGCTQVFALRKCSWENFIHGNCEQFSLEHLGVGIEMQCSLFNHSFIKLITS